MLLDYQTTEALVLTAVIAILSVVTLVNTDIR